MLKNKHRFPSYSQGLGESASDPWLRLLRMYRTVPVRPYRPCTFSDMRRQYAIA